MVLSLLAAVVGCGYKSDELYDRSIRTVAVPIFESREFRRELEFRLTEAVIKRIETDTPYKVVDQSRADTILIGEVLEVRQNHYAPDVLTELPRVQIATLTIRLQWKDLRTGRIIVDRPNFVQTVDYLPTLFETEYLATNEAIDRMAERIAELMQEPW